MTHSESRASAAEDPLTAAEARMERLVTKEDLEKFTHSICKTIWLAVSVIVGIAVFIIKYG